MDNKRASLQKQLAEAKKHLLLVQERMTEYVDPTKIPLEQTRLERHWQAQITELEAQLAQLSEDDTESPLDSGPQFPIFEVPFHRDPNFTGREDILAEISHHLNAKGTAIQVQAITGLGGVGKSKSATEYAYRHAEAYDLIWWVPAETDETLTASYLDLAQRLHLLVKTGAEQAIFVNVVRDWLKNTDRRWLIIFDNAEDPERLQALLPVKGNGQVVVTSRNPNWGQIAKVSSLSPWSLIEAREFLRKRTGENNEAAADQVAEMLGRLPLALAQAAAYMSEQRLPLEQYAALYKSQRQELWQREKPPQDYEATVTTTWEIGFRQVKQDSPAAVALLNLCSFLNPDEIPLSMLHDGVAYLPEVLARAVKSPFELGDAIAILYKYSFIERKRDSLSIHRVLQDVARERLGSKRAGTWVKTVLDLLKLVFPFDKYKIETWPASAQILPHVLAAVAHEERYHVAPELSAALWQQVGEYLREQGDYVGAQTGIEHALALRKQVLGENDRLVAESLDYLGELNQEQANYDQARIYHEQALHIRQVVCGQEHQDTALSLNNLGVLFHSQGQYEQARPYYEEALAIRKRVLGDNNPDTAMSLNNLGTLLQSQGQYEQAGPYYEEALNIRKHVLGDNHPDTATSLNSLGALLHSQGQYERARPYYEEALAITKRVLGDNHPSTARSFNNLGGLLQDRGQYEQARPYLEETLAIIKRVLGDNHPDTAMSLNNLGELLKSQGQYEQARSCHEEALAIRKRVLGDNHPDTATSLNNLGLLLYEQGQYERARPYHEEALAILKRALGDNHPDTALSLNNLGTLLCSQGKYVEARPYLEQALNIYETVHGEKHPRLVAILSNLGGIMFSLKQFRQARLYLTQAATICRETDEQYAECERVKLALKSLPGEIGRRKGKEKREKEKRAQKRRR